MNPDAVLRRFLSAPLTLRLVAEGGADPVLPGYGRRTLEPDNWAVEDGVAYGQEAVWQLAGVEDGVLLYGWGLVDADGADIEVREFDGGPRLVGERGMVVRVQPEVAVVAA